MDPMDEGPVEVSGAALRKALKRLDEKAKNRSEAQEIRAKTKNDLKLNWSKPKTLFFIAMLPFMLIAGLSVGLFQSAVLACTHNRRKRHEAQILKENIEMMESV